MTYSPLTAVYNPKAFIPHAASLRQAFAHCGRFSTAASRRSLASVSVPVWPANLSVRLPVFALVSRYLTNKLVGLEPLSWREVRRPPLYSQRPRPPRGHPVLPSVSRGYPGPGGKLPEHYSPFRRSTGEPKFPFALDLHA